MSEHIRTVIDAKEYTKLEAELAAEREKVERLEGLLKQVSERVDQLTDIPMVMLGAAVIAIRVDIAAALNPDGEKPGEDAEA